MTDSWALSPLPEKWVPPQGRPQDWPQLDMPKGFSGGSDGKESACTEGDLGLTPGSGRFPGEGNGNPLQYSCMEISMDRGAWQATVHRVTRSQIRPSNFHFRNSKGCQMAQAEALLCLLPSPASTETKGVPGKRGDSPQERMKDVKVPGRLGLESGFGPAPELAGSGFPVGHMERLSLPGCLPELPGGGLPVGHKGLP